MIVAIQQPEHIPWMGFFNKMSQCDLYVLLDNVQFKKRYFENRNRINTDKGARWFTVAVHSKGRYLQRINEIVIDDESPRIRKYTGLLEHTYKKYPFWKDVKDIIFPCIYENKSRLLDLNLALIDRLKEYLKIKTPCILSSSLGVDGFKGSELMLNICLKIKAHIYISGPDGKDYLNIDEFKKKGTHVVYHNFQHPEYSCLQNKFIPSMSIIDLIANCGSASGEIVRKCYKMDFNNA